MGILTKRHMGTFTDCNHIKSSFNFIWQYVWVRHPASQAFLSFKCRESQISRFQNNKTAAQLWFSLTVMITVRFLTTSFHLGPVFLEILDNIKWLNMIKVALYMRQVKVTSKVIHLKPACPTSGSLNPAADATILAATSDSTSKSYSNVWKTSRQTYRFDTCWQPTEDGNNTFKRILRRSETKIWRILCLLRLKGGQ